MPSKQYRRESQNPGLVDCNCLDSCAVIVRETPQHVDTSAQKPDWILFPDTCQVPNYKVSRDVVPVQPKSCEGTERNLHRRQHPEANEDGKSSRKDSDTFDEMAYPELWPANECSSPNPTDTRHTPPSRPTPQRLPTPDLPEIEQSDFWSCCELYKSNIRDSNGILAKPHRLQELR